MFQLIKVTWEWQVRLTEVKQKKWNSNKSTYQDSCFSLTSSIIRQYGGGGGGVIIHLIYSLPTWKRSLEEDSPFPALLKQS